MYDKKLFDDWSNTYDASVRESDMKNRYPFAGYAKIQEKIFTTVITKNKGKLLEMGIGTGQMTKALYQVGYDITGVDFSSNMIEKAKQIMPSNNYINKDFISALKDLDNTTFDVVLFSYSIHHIGYDEQVKLINKLKDYLKEDGIIIIGDVMTNTKDEMIELSTSVGKYWDDEEFYPIVEVYQNNGYKIDYEQITFCSGIMTLKNL